MKDENYFTLLADTCLYNPTRYLRFLRHSLRTVRCLQLQQIHQLLENVRPAVPISSNQVSSLANVAEFTGMPSSKYSMATKISRRHFKFKLKSSVWLKNTGNLRKSPLQKAKETKNHIDSGTDVYWLSLKTLNLPGKTALTSVRNFNQIKFRTVLRNWAFSCMVAFLTDRRLVFRSSLGNQQIHFDCCRLQSDIKCEFFL